MATDYDAPRRRPGDVEEQPDALPVSTAPKDNAASVDLGDDTGALETLDLPLGDIDEALDVKVVPKQPDEFTCGSCWMVRHQSQRVSAGSNICVDCD